MSNKYKSIKRETTFPITIGGNTLINFQKLILFLLSDKTEEEINKAHEQILKQQYDEEWYEHVAFVSMMIRTIEVTAEEKGFLIEEDLDNISKQDS